jgi:adenylate cyclase
LKHISPQHNYKIRELLFIVAYWVLIIPLAFVLLFYDNRILSLSETQFIIILRDNISISVFIGFIIGLITGLAELFFFQNYFQFKSFYKTLALKLFLNIVSVIVIAITAVYLYQSVFKGLHYFDAVLRTLEIFKHLALYQLILVTLILSLSINFILIIKSNIGHSIFLPIIMGKYHQPKEEDRIFLFLDLSSSTQMAEKLGHVKYSKLIQECFRELGDLVIENGGSVYQFVGDEAVITWKAKKENYLRSVKLFLAFDALLTEKAEEFEKVYGIRPVFKGTINAGNVMVAEVGGKVKSEIAFHGDVLNTASRMMELNIRYKKQLIISERIAIRIKTQADYLRVAYQGEHQFRGKNNIIKVFSVEDTW